MPGALFQFTQSMQVIEPGDSIYQLFTTRGHLLSCWRAFCPLPVNEQEKGGGKYQDDDAAESQGNAGRQVGAQRPASLDSTGCLFLVEDRALLQQSVHSA